MPHLKQFTYIDAGAAGRGCKEFAGLTKPVLPVWNARATCLAAAFGWHFTDLFGCFAERRLAGPLMVH